MCIRDRLGTAGSGTGALMTDGSEIRTEKTGTRDPEDVYKRQVLIFVLALVLNLKVF